MAIKDWKKKSSSKRIMFSKNTPNNFLDYASISIVFPSLSKSKDQEVLEISKDGKRISRTEYDVIIYEGNSGLPIQDTFKTKIQALKYAKRYMQTH